jgi:predicted  nucleic acid-binding Zn-ribbon protein
MQSKNEEFTKLSVTSEQIKVEFQILKADRDKLQQEIATLSQSQASLEKNAEVQSKEVEKRQVRSNFTFM